MVIQRLQSLWLLLAAGCMGLFAFMPFARFGDLYMTSLQALPYFIYNIAIAVLLLLNIFLYSTIRYQRMFTKVLLWLIAGSGVCAALLMYLPDTADGAPAWGWCLLVAAFVLGLMAYRGIRSDMRKLRDADRLR